MAKYFTRTRRSTQSEKRTFGFTEILGRVFITRLYFRKRWYLPKQKLNWWMHYGRVIPRDAQNEIDLLIENDKQLNNGN